jgi:hypothetical protein
VTLMVMVGPTAHVDVYGVCITCLIYDIATKCEIKPLP